MHDLAVSLPASILSDWHSREPARMLAALRALGVGDARLLLLGAELLRACRHTDEGIILQLELWAKSGRIEDAPEWLENWDSAEDVLLHLLDWSKKLTKNIQCAYISCLFGDEFAAAREVCDQCNGQGKYSDYSQDGSWWQNDIPCSDCHGLGSVRATVECGGRIIAGTLSVGGYHCEKCAVRFGACPRKDFVCRNRIPAPLLDPRWLSSNVVGMARTIQGAIRYRAIIHTSGGPVELTDASWEVLGEKVEVYCRKDWPNVRSHSAFGQYQEPPRPERMPILAEALDDAGCTNEAILAHCRAGWPHGEPAKMHLPGCWVIREILGGT